MKNWAEQHIKDLSESKTIVCNPTGKSMQPKIFSGDTVTIQPIAEKKVNHPEI